MTTKTRSERQKPKPEFIEGPKALRNFTETMRGLFRVPESEIKDPDPVDHHKTKKAGS